MNFIKNQQII